VYAAVPVPAFAAEGRGGDRDRFARRLHADVEIGFDVDAHAIPGDDGVLLRSRDRHRQQFMLTGVKSWMKGRTKAPPLITTCSPRKPVRTNDTSLEDR